MNFRRLLLVVCLFCCHLSWAQEKPDTTLLVGRTQARVSGEVLKRMGISRVDPAEEARSETMMLYLQFGHEACVNCQILRGMIRNVGEHQHWNTDFALLSNFWISDEVIPFLSNDLPNESPAARLFDAPMGDSMGHDHRVLAGTKITNAPWRWVGEPGNLFPESIHSSIYKIEQTGVFPFTTIRLF